MAGAIAPTVAVVLSPARLRVALILASALAALVACGIVGGRLAGIPARTEVRRLLSGGALAVDVCALALVFSAVRR